MSNTIEVNSTDLNRVIKGLRELDPKVQQSPVYKGMVDCSLMMEKALKNYQRFSSLKRRSGYLARSIGSVVVQEEGEIVGIVGSGVRTGSRVKYADIHERGGIIRPKRAKYLTIPIGRSKTKSGIGRFSARDIMGGFTNYDETAVFKSKRGNLIYWGVRKLKKGRKLEPLFVLVKQVKIPARRYMSLTARANTQRVMRQLQNRITEHLRNG